MGWMKAGYLAEPVQRRTAHLAKMGVDSISNIDESYGRDIGSEVPLCLLAEGSDAETCRLDAEEWAAAAQALDDHGVTLLQTLLPLSKVHELRERLHVHGSALDNTKKNSTASGVAAVREYDCSPLQEEDPDLEPIQSTPGRRHFYLRGRLLEEAVKHVQTGAMPLVWEYLSRVAPDPSFPSRRRPYISEVQLIVSDPCAVDQFWHVDNTAPGLTLLVPLTPVPAELGPTLFLPGSHHLFEERTGRFSRLRNFLASVLASDGVTVGAMGPGDALVYDSRIVHRGAANRKYNRTRVALIFRYDFERPPGIGPVGSQLMSWSGNIMSGLLSSYSMLPGSAPVDPASA